MMRIALINLAAQEARWRSASGQFFALGMCPTREEAVAGTGLTLSERAQLYDESLNARKYHKPLRPGEIGCYASHLRCWRELVASGERAMAIFEDDIEIADDLPRVLDALGQLRVPCDLVKLIGRRQEKIHDSVPLCPGRDLIAYRRVPSLTGAYVITAGGARKLLRNRPPFGRPVDVDIRHWWEHDLRVLGAHPYPVRAGDSSKESTIEGRGAGACLASRSKKLALQVSYTFENWLATRAQPPLAPAGSQAAPPPEWSPGRDAA
jgi:glycosyl transferase, family 25